MKAGAGRAVLSAASGLRAGTPAETIGAQNHRVTLAAAQAAGAHAFVAELPEGYDTPVGDGGIILAASQRLRLAVARLLAADPPAIVLEDPTAGLDTLGEAAALPGLEALLRGREITVVGASPAVRAALVRATGGARPARRHASRLPKDPCLPSLTRLLDAHEMAPLLGAMLVGGESDVRVHSVRYKPGDNVVVQYGVLTPSGWGTAVAYSRAGSGLKRKRKSAPNRKLVRRAADRTPALEPFAYFPEVSALVQWLPLDVRLPILCDSAERLAGRLAKKGIVATDLDEIELLRYWPRRRAVLRFGAHILKVYRDGSDFDEARRALRASKMLKHVRTAAYVGALKARQVTVQEWLPGRGPSLWPASSEAAGRVVADLHRDVPLSVPTMTPRRILAKAAVRGGFIGHLVPGLRSDVATLMGDLAAMAPPEMPSVTSHGNFHAGQLLAGPSGLALIDLDRMCQAAPAYDLATFAAHVAFGRPGEMDVVGAATDSLVAGYGSRPLGLNWYLATCLLRRAAVPFRFQDEHWPEAVAELVRHAREALR